MRANRKGSESKLFWFQSFQVARMAASYSGPTNML